MPIDDLAVRFRELGRLKFGEELADRPAILDVWRLTSRHFDLLEAAAKLYGGTVASTDGGYELTTTTDALDVVLPLQDVAAGQFWELWTRGGLQRRCTGSNLVELDDSVFGGVVILGPCACNLEGRKLCKINTVLRVIIPELPDLGVWRLSTRSVYAAMELPGAAHVLQSLAGAELPRAVLALDKRTAKRPGQPEHRFVVPILRSRDTYAELAGDRTSAPGPGGPISPTPLRPALAGGSPGPAEDPTSGPGSAPQRPQDEPNPETRPTGHKLPQPGPEVDAWAVLGAFLDEHPPDWTNQADSADLIPAVLELERLMLEAGAWRLGEETGALPLDLAAVRFLSADHVPLLRAGQLALKDARPFVGRAFLKAWTLFDEDHRGDAYRARQAKETP